MRVLIVHHEGRYYGGTEVLLGSFLATLRESGVEVTAAVAGDSRLADALPRELEIMLLPDNERFSPFKFVSQLRTLARCRGGRAVDVVHGWGARDWELAAAAGALLRRPAVGTLHDHPRAAYISTRRQTLMRHAANHGLDRITCPSEAVRIACVDAGYAARKLAVVSNGVQLPPVADRPASRGRMRLGFLGVFSEGKGLSGLFEMMTQLEQSRPDTWELHIAGAAQTAAGETLVRSIRERYGSTAWWPRVHWRGWTEDQVGFLLSIDVLVAPFTQFEAFGLVVCEAGAAGIPAVSTRIAAIEEMVDDGRTGWLFPPGDWSAGARILADLIDDAAKHRAAGEAARARVAERFTIDAMARGFTTVYSEVA